MSLRVSNLKRAKAFEARKALPTDVKAEYQALYGPAWEAIFSAPPNTPVTRHPPFSSFEKHDAAGLGPRNGRECKGCL